MEMWSDGRRRARERALREGPRPAARLVPLAVAAVLLGVRLLVWPAWGSTAGSAVWGFGLILLAGALHLVAVRMPGRYAVEGAAWVATIIAALALLVLLMPAGGR